MSKQAQLQTIIGGLRQAIPEIQGVLVASTDGLPIAHEMPSGADANRTAAMAATALGLGKRITSALEFGEMRETLVNGTDGQLFLYACGVHGVLALLAPVDANVGLIHLEARNAAGEIATALSPALAPVAQSA